MKGRMPVPKGFRPAHRPSAMQSGSRFVHIRSKMYATGETGRAAHGWKQRHMQAIVLGLQYLPVLAVVWRWRPWPAEPASLWLCLTRCVRRLGCLT